MRVYIHTTYESLRFTAVAGSALFLIAIFLFNSSDGVKSKNSIGNVGASLCTAEERGCREDRWLGCLSVRIYTRKFIGEIEI